MVFIFSLVSVHQLEFSPQTLCCYGKQLCTIPRDAAYFSYQNRYEKRAVHVITDAGKTWMLDEFAKGKGIKQSALKLNLEMEAEKDAASFHPSFHLKNFVFQNTRLYFMFPMFLTLNGA